MSDEPTDHSSKRSLKRVVGILVPIIFLIILTVTIYIIVHTSDNNTEDNYTEGPNYLDLAIDDLNKYGGTIYFGPSRAIDVPEKSNIQVEDGMVRVTYWTESTYHDSEGYHIYYYLHTYYGSIAQITYISIASHR